MKIGNNGGSNLPGNEPGNLESLGITMVSLSSGEVSGDRPEEKPHPPTTPLGSHLSTTMINIASGLWGNSSSQHAAFSLCMVWFATIELSIGAYLCISGAHHRPFDTLSVLFGVFAILIAIVILLGTVTCGWCASQRDSGSRRPDDAGTSPLPLPSCQGLA